MIKIIRQFIEALHADEQCPRLLVNALVDGVIVPDHIREKWGNALPIDLEPSYPLELQMTDEGLACCLSFGGPFECFFPWKSIYVVQDRATQMGVVVEDNVPQSVQVQKEMADGVVLKRTEPNVQPELKKQREVQTSPQPAVAPVAERATEKPSEEEVDLDTPEARRARFRVIDGGRGR